MLESDVKLKTCSAILCSFPISIASLNLKLLISKTIYFKLLIFDNFALFELHIPELESSVELLHVMALPSYKRTSNALFFLNITLIIYTKCDIVTMLYAYKLADRELKTLCL